MSVKYFGIYNDSNVGDLYEVVVERDGETPYALDHRLDLIDHSPTGICWGYNGSGPAQCSFAILADYLKDDNRALALYQDFKFMIVSKFPMNESWELTGDEIDAAVTAIHKIYDQVEK